MSGLALAIAIEAATEARAEIAKRMIMAHEPPSQITEFADLDKGTIEALAEELGVVLPDPVKPP